MYACKEHKSFEETYSKQDLLDFLTPMVDTREIIGILSFLKDSEYEGIHVLCSKKDKEGYNRLGVIFIHFETIKGSLSRKGGFNCEEIDFDGTTLTIISK